MPSTAVWDFWAPRYHRLFVQHFVLEPTRRLVLKYLDEHVPAARRICDVGCGIGQLARELAVRRPGAQVLGIDPSPAMIARAGELPPMSNLTFRSGSLDAVAGETFDVILATHAFPYFPDKQAALRRIHDLLAPGGLLVLAQATGENAYDRFVHVFLKLAVSPVEYLSTIELTALLVHAGLAVADVAPLARVCFIPSVFLVTATWLP